MPGLFVLPEMSSSDKPSKINPCAELIICSFQEHWAPAASWALGTERPLLICRFWFWFVELGMK